jgi:hypothetical protein
MEGKGRTGVPFAGKVSRQWWSSAGPQEDNPDCSEDGQVMGFQTYFLPVFESNAGVGMGAGTPW